MKLDRVKQILKKVNALIENLEDQGQTSAIERDLLLRYLRDLYENVSQPKTAIDTIMDEVDLAPSPIAENPSATARPMEATVNQPADVVEQSAPIIEQSAPAIEQPAPVIEQPAPIIEQSAPVIEQSAPIIEQPSPLEEQVLQSKEQVAPVVENSGPVEYTDKEKTTPIANTGNLTSEAGQESQTTFYDASVKRESAVEASAPGAPVSTPPEEAVINKFENPVQYFPPIDEAGATNTPPMSTAPTAHTSQQGQDSMAGTATLEDAQGRFEDLFAEKSAQDIADKYQLQKVVTIEGAMGINERMQTINELFGGDHNVFMETVNHIHQLSGFNSAKKYLIEGVATKFSWDKDEHKEMASDFVQLVRRKFA